MCTTYIWGHTIAVRIMHCFVHVCVQTHTWRWVASTAEASYKHICACTLCTSISLAAVCMDMLCLLLPRRLTFTRTLCMAATCPNYSKKECNVITCSANMSVFSIQ